MRLFTGLLFFFLSVFAFAEKQVFCGPGKITYKIGTEVFTQNSEICKNKYSQFYAKKCANGCEFKKSLQKNPQIKVTQFIVGSPGGQVCRKLGFQSYLVEITFKGQETPHVDLCFGNDKSSFVSTGFLRDLQGSKQ